MLGLELVFSKKKYWLVMLISFIIVSALFILIPVFTTPGNTIEFQLSVFKTTDYIIIVLLSFLTSLLMTMQVYLWDKNRVEAKKLLLGGTSSITALIVGTAACSSCLAAFFGFLGIGAVLFIAENQWPIFFLSSSLLLISIYLTSKKIKGVCETC